MSLNLTNFLPSDKFLRLIQILSTCRGQNNSDSKIEICVGKSRKHCGKRRKCWLPAFSPFPTMFSLAFFSTEVKSWDCVVIGQRFDKNTVKSVLRRSPALRDHCSDTTTLLNPFPHNDTL